MTFKCVNILLFTMLLNAQLCNSYHILVIFGHPGKSHYDVFHSFFQRLAERGHNLTILSHVHIENSRNIRHVTLRDEQPMTHVMDLAHTGQPRLLDYYYQSKLISDFASLNCLKDLQNSRFQNFLKEDNQFDLIMGEMFNTNCFNGLINKFKAPFIGLSSCALLPWQPAWFGVPSNPSYLQVLLGGFKTPMTFLSRVENTLVYLFADTWYTFTMDKPGQAFSRKYIGYEPADPYNTSLILVNSHYTIHGARPFTPNVVEVAGIHIDNKKPKKLPRDIENWINSSAAGVIYFSLGSMVKGDTFPEEQRKVFLRAFSKFPQRVMWKWESDTMPDKPDNVMIRKWLPQLDILCHPNVKAFMSHGGLLGTIEAIHCGVPVILMPQFGDQRYNSHAIVNRDVGAMLHLQSATEEEVTEALRKVFEPKTFRRVKELSEVFRDRPVSPMDAAIYWVEHVAKYRGAQHMRSPAIDMPFYQYFLLDVICFLTVLALFIAYILYVVFKRVLSLVRFTKKEAKKKLS